MTKKQKNRIYSSQEGNGSLWCKLRKHKLMLYKVNRTQYKYECTRCHEAGQYFTDQNELAFLSWVEKTKGKIELLT